MGEYNISDYRSKEFKMFDNEGISPVEMKPVMLPGYVVLFVVIEEQIVSQSAVYSRSSIITLQYTFLIIKMYEVTSSR